MGKALVKTHLQMFACALLMSDAFSKAAAAWAAALPVVGGSVIEYMDHEGCMDECPFGRCDEADLLGGAISAAILRQSATYASELDHEDVEAPKEVRSIFARCHIMCCQDVSALVHMSIVC